MKYVASAQDVISEHIRRPLQENPDDGDASGMGASEAESGAGVTRLVYCE